MKKRCTACNELKPLSEFSPNPIGLFGRQSHCKPCAAANQRKRREDRAIREVNRALVDVTNAARVRLIAQHRAEYEALVDEERLKRGLGPSMRSPGCVVTTPREQLIEAIALAVANRPNPVELAREPHWAHRADANAALQALSDLGAVVLMPVKPGESVANVIVLNEKHVLRTTQEERTDGVYVNALDSEQS